MARHTNKSRSAQSRSGSNAMSPVMRLDKATDESRSSIQQEFTFHRKAITRCRRLAAIHGKWLGLLIFVVFYLYAPQLSRHMALMHEGLNIYIRPQQYESEMRAGFWQPMLLPDTMRSAGFAFPVFYPPFSYYLAAIINMVTGERMFGLNAALFLSVLVSAIACYGCGFSITRRPSIAAMVSILSITVAYRFVNVYVRGALAESWGTAWYAIALYGALEQLRYGRRGWLLAVGLAGALISHTVVTMYFVTLFAVLMLVTFAFKWQLRSAISLFVYGVLALMLAAWYLIPQQAYLSGVWASDPETMWATPERLFAHAVDFEQLFESEPDRWWGASYGHPNDKMSFRLGFGYLVVAGVLWSWLFVGRRWRNANSRLYLGIGIGSLLVVVASILFLMWPRPFFVLLPKQFSYLQFPWRLLSVLPIFATALAGVCLQWLRQFPRRHIDWLMMIVCAVLVVEVPYFYTVRRLKLDVTSKSLTADFARKYGDKGCTELAEYMPRSYPVEQAEHFFIEQPQVTDGQLLAWKRDPELLSCTVEVACGPSGGRVTVPVAYYPFWSAESAGGENVALDQDRGYIALKVPAGNSTITLSRHYTQPYFTGWMLTIAGLVALIGFAYWGEPMLQRRRNTPAT